MAEYNEWLLSGGSSLSPSITLIDTSNDSVEGSANAVATWLAE